MYIKESELVKIKVSKTNKSKWEKKIGTIIEGDELYVHWSLLKSSKFRTEFIEVICDDCKSIHRRRIRDLDPDNNLHYCKKCFNKGERNPQYGKPCSENSKKATKKFMELNGNPFTWEETKIKIKLSDPWKKIAKSNLGLKRSDETKQKQSKSAILAFKEGRRSPHSGWAKQHMKEYNGLKYQSKNEIKLIQYLESKGKFDLIEPGPVVTYFDEIGKEHAYFIDFKIKNSNIVFEVKSWYYWEKKKKINIIKKEAASKIYEFYLIMDNNFTEIDRLIQNEKI